MLQISGRASSGSPYFRTVVLLFIEKHYKIKQKKKKRKKQQQQTNVYEHSYLRGQANCDDVSKITWDIRKHDKSLKKCLLLLLAVNKS